MQEEANATLQWGGYGFKLCPARKGADVRRVPIACTRAGVPSRGRWENHIKEGKQKTAALCLLVHLRPKGIVTASLYRKGGLNVIHSGGWPYKGYLMGGLSRMKGNFHVRF